MKKKISIFYFQFNIFLNYLLKFIKQYCDNNMDHLKDFLCKEYNIPKKDNFKKISNILSKYNDNSDDDLLI